MSATIERRGRPAAPGLAAGPVALLDPRTTTRTPSGDPACERRDATVKRALRADGIEACSHKANVWFEPWEVMNGQGEPYRVFTPYWRNARARLVPRAPGAAPARITPPALAGGLAIDALGLRPSIDWANGLREAWVPGEAGAPLVDGRHPGPERHGEGREHDEVERQLEKPASRHDSFSGASSATSR